MDNAQFVQQPPVDRRIGIERRQFSYSSYIPERRVTIDRRSGIDRRVNLKRRLADEV